jgi:hypothetical protein
VMREEKRGKGVEEGEEIEARETKKSRERERKRISYLNELEGGDEERLCCLYSALHHVGHRAQSTIGRRT